MKATFDMIMSALTPVFIGAAMAFLANPLTNQVETWLKKRSVKKGTRALGILTSIVVYGTLLYVAFYLIVPKVAESLIGLRRFVLWADELLKQNEQVYQIAQDIWTEINEKFNGWLKEGLMTTLMSTLGSVANGVYNIAAIVVDAANLVLNVLIGIIVMIYLLLGKDDYVGQSKKILYAVCRNKKYAAAVLDVMREAYHIFHGFITGKLLDSLIIGIICFVCVSILDMPYALLVSVIVGVTNVIPVFGPFIGAIPSAFLILLVDPMKCLIFVIFIIILQQIDGNIIGPMILGDSTGLNAFWVMFSILIFGKLMGVVGMIIGVPLFATFFYVVKRATEAALRKRNLPTDTEDYIKIDYIDEENGLHYLRETKKRSSKRKEARERRKKKAELREDEGKESTAECDNVTGQQEDGQQNECGEEKEDRRTGEADGRTDRE